MKRPFSELSESSGVFSQQLSEFKIPFSEYDIPFSAWHPNTNTTILGATPGAIPGIDGNPHERFSFAPAVSGGFFRELGWSPRARLDVPHRDTCWQTRGRYTRLRLCRQSHGNESDELPTSPPPTKGCRQPVQKTVKSFVKSFAHSKNMVLPAVPTLHFFSFNLMFHELFCTIVVSLAQSFGHRNFSEVCCPI